MNKYSAGAEGVCNLLRQKGVSFYDPEITNEYAGFQKERLSRSEISDYHYRNIRSAANRLNEFYLTGTVYLRIPKHGTKYLLKAENERLIDRFLDYKDYGPNTRGDVVWVVRRYLYHFETLGHGSLEHVSVDDVRQFILKTAAEVKTSSLHNILLYLKYFHIFLKETGIPAPDCTDLFSYKVYRDMPIQGYVTDEELERILAVIDIDSDMGKRNRAIILTAATTGLRACDLIHLRLSDIDWRTGEIRLCQKKTGMFKQYQKKAGIARHAFDGKGFHGLRRRLAKKLLVTGTPLTTIAQILGHDDLKSSRQYLLLDTGNLKECAPDFRGIPITSRNLNECDSN